MLDVRNGEVSEEDSRFVRRKQQGSERTLGMEGYASILKIKALLKSCVELCLG